MIRKTVIAFALCGLYIFGVNTEETSACQSTRDNPKQLEMITESKLPDGVKMDVKLIAVTPSDNPGKETELVAKNHVTVVEGVKLPDEGKLVYVYMVQDDWCFPISEKVYHDPEDVKKLVKEKKLKVLGEI